MGSSGRITNAHVIATMQNPVIMDGKGNSYEIKSMLALPERDIVLFEFKNPGNLKPIPITYNVASIPINSNIYAYGNSQGEGVITKLNGTLQGVGPQKIEITAGIVPGNSGGPVIYQNRLIGVSTYMTRSEAGSWTLQGTRFERRSSIFGNKYGGIRRFAARIDSINPEQTEILNPISSAEDTEIINELKEANNAASNYVFKEIKGYLKCLKVVKITDKLLMQTLCLACTNDNLRKTIENCYSKLRIDPNKYNCSNKILGKQLLEQISIYRRNSCLWKFEELFSSREPIFVKGFAVVVRNLKRYYKKPQRCPVCKGKGFLLVEKELSPRDDGKLSYSFKTIRNQCKECNGKGFIQKCKYYYILRNKQYADKIYTKLPVSFLGFQLGATFAESRNEIKRMKFSARIIWDINSTFIYTKSPRFPLADALVLNFVFGKLQEIRIHFPYTKNLYQQMKDRLGDKYGKIVWETEDKSSFCRIDNPEFAITIGVRYILSEGQEPKTSLFVSCKHKKLSNAKFLFNKLRYTASRVEDFKIEKPEDTGF